LGLILDSSVVIAGRIEGDQTARGVTIAFEDLLIAAARPDKVKELLAVMDGFLKDTKAVLPVRNPNYNPAARPPSPLPVP
jgi:hypothetical protein